MGTMTRGSAQANGWVRRNASALATRIRRRLAREMDGTSHLELDGPIVIRKDAPGDATALRRLAELDSRTLPEGSFLLAEVRGELVAAAALDVDCEPLKDPFRRTFNVRQLLELQAGYVRLAGRPAAAPKAGPATATVAGPLAEGRLGRPLTITKADGA